METCRWLVFHDDSRECWREGQSIEQRDGYGDSHRKTELRIEGSRDTADKTDWHKNRHEHKCGGNECRRYAVHSLLSQKFRV